MTELIFLGTASAAFLLGIAVGCKCRSQVTEDLKLRLRMALSSVEYHREIVRQYEACVDEPETESARVVTVQ